MSNILLDTWTINNASHQLIDNKYFEDDNEQLCLSHLIMAVVFWDELNFPECNGFDRLTLNNNSTLWDFVRLCKPLEEGLFMGGSVRFKGSLLHEYEKNFEDNAKEDKKRNYDYLAGRAEAYLDFSNRHELNYFPHPDRQMYILEKKMLEDRFDRREILDGFNKNIADRYRDLTKDSRFNLLRFSYPAIYGYIKYGTGSPLEELDKAIYLRSKKDVVEFRKSLNDLDKAIKTNDIPFIVAAQEQLDELSNAIASYCSKDVKIVINKLKAKLNFGASIAGASIGGERSVIKEVESNKAHKPIRIPKGVLNLVFLKDVVKFSTGKKVK